MMNKRIVALLLSTVMVTSIAGCVNTPNQESGKSSEQQPGKTSEGTQVGKDSASASESGKTSEQQSSSSGTQAATDSTDAKESEKAYDPFTVKTHKDGSKIDLGGMEIILTNWFSTRTRLSEQEALTETVRQTVEYYAWLEETYNCTIWQESAPIAEDQSYEDFYVQYNDEKANEPGVARIFLFDVTTESIDLARNNKSYNLSSFDDLLNLKNAEKWHQGVQNLYSKDGNVYGMSNVQLLEKSLMMFMNSAVVKNAGIDPDSIYELVKNDKWTWEEFEKVCKAVKKDTDNDGTIDIFGFGSGLTWAGKVSQIIPDALISNGVDPVSIVNGKYVDNMTSQQAIDALNWAQRMMNDYGYQIKNDRWEEFINGQFGFMYNYGYVQGRLKDLDNWGFLPLPKGPNGKGATIGYKSKIFLIPANYNEDKAWALAFIRNEMLNPLPDPEGFDKYLSMYQTIPDEKSVDIVFPLLDEAEYKPLMNHEFIKDYTMPKSIMEGKTPAQALEEVADVNKSAIDAMNK